MQILFWFVGLSFVLAAAAMGVIAWRTARGVRERESARAELLRALAFPDAAVVPASGPAITDWMAEFPSEKQTTPVAGPLEAAPPIFAERAEPVMALPRWATLAGVAAAMALGVTLYAVIAGRPEAASATTPAARATEAPATPTTVNAGATAVPDRPLELIALQHQFGRATAFDVSGRVHNPGDGRALPHLMAVVNLFDADGRLLMSQMTPLERPVLEAGQTATFSLAFPRVPGTVARYRVEFHLQGRETIKHVDRRAPERGATAPAS